MKTALLIMLLVASFASQASIDLCTTAPSVKRQKLDAYPEKRSVIESHFLHAIFSAIAYEDEGLGGYALPEGWQRLKSKADKVSGLYIAIFKNIHSKEIVIAFRGTEFTSLADWVHNLFPLLKIQSAPAIRKTQEAISENACDGCTFTLTGHSLGGGLAIQLSHRLKDVRAVAFNPSPRIGLERSGYRNYRAVFRERSEPLALFRGNPSQTKGWQLTYNVLLNFEDGFIGRKAVKQHSMESLAKNILVLAAGWSKSAAELREQMCSKPKV